MKVRFGIRAKILIPFLALVLVSLGGISSLALRSIYEVGSIAKENSISMGETVARDSIAALEDLGRRMIQRRATYVANEIELFLSHLSVCKGVLYWYEEPGRFYLIGWRS